MALVIEDGSNVASANSFATLDEIKAYNVLRGRSFGATADAVIEGWAILAMDYIAAREIDMLGVRTYGLDQPLSYPRENVIIGGEYLANDAIPVELKNAEAELVWQQKNGIDIMQTFSGQAVKRRKVGPIEREFFAPASAPTMITVEQWLATLLIGGIGFHLRVERI